MNYGNLEAMLGVLEEREQAKQDALLGTVRQEAKNVSDKIINDHLVKLEQRKRWVQKEIDTRRRQEETRIKMREDQKVNLYKQELIQTELERCLAYQSHLPVSDYLKVLEQNLLAAEVDSPILKIQVPVDYAEAVSEKLADRYVIEAKNSLGSGYVLVCENYDVNHEVSEFFQFKKQELSRTMMKYLFEDE